MSTRDLGTIRGVPPITLSPHAGVEVLDRGPAPRVSVVMPVFNGERFIAEAVESVLASEFRDFELLLLIDAGCTDASDAAAERAAGNDSRVRLIRHPHVTPAVARNVGLSQARGEFVANLDCDDAMFPERLTRQVDYLDAHPECVAVGSRALIVDVDNEPVRIGVRAYTHEEIDGAHLDGRGGTIMNPTATFRRAAALSIDGYSSDLLTTGEDHDFWLRLAEVGRLVNLPEVLIRYRIHDANASIGATNSERRLAVTMEILSRTFTRRGITDREPAKRKAPPMRAWERWTDRALMRYYRGDRIGAAAAALVGVALQPGAAAARVALASTLRTPPRWARPRVER